MYLSLFMISKMISEMIILGSLLTIIYVPSANVKHVSTIKCNSLGAYSLSNSLHPTFIILSFCNVSQCQYVTTYVIATWHTGLTSMGWQLANYTSYMTHQLC